MSAPDRRAKLDRAHGDLSLRRQCAMLGLARSGVYRKPRPANDNDLNAMRRIDALFTARRFYGARRIARTLTEEGFPIDRKRVRRLMRRMGIEALGPKPRTSNRAPGHKIYRYLLRDLTIDRPNQVWAADITYIPIGRGFLYLVAVIDWASRAVLSWRLSNAMDAWFCLAALEDALARYGKPEIFNTDQGSQFTRSAFTGVLIEAGVRISMDGRGRWMDNVFIERLHRTRLALAQARGRLSERLCRRPRGESRHRRILRLLQRAPPSSGARLSHADGRLARRRGAGGLWTCGQRSCVDHMPTGGSESAADRTLGGLIKDNQQTAFQLNRRQKRSRFAGPLHFERVSHDITIASTIYDGLKLFKNPTTDPLLYAADIAALGNDLIG
jgi:putative transposase